MFLQCVTQQVVFLDELPFTTFHFEFRAEVRYPNTKYVFPLNAISNKDQSTSLNNESGTQPLQKKSKEVVERRRVWAG